MSIRQGVGNFEAPPIDLHGLIRELFAINRSLTGAGVRETLAILERFIRLEMREVPSGTAVLDWQVPLKWNIRGATIKTLDGHCLVDFADNNLHVVGYSKPVHKEVRHAELAQHVHTLPNQPELSFTARATLPTTGAFACLTIFGERCRTKRIALISTAIFHRDH